MFIMVQESEMKKNNKIAIIATVIIMTGYPSIEVVIEAMHSGASDFLVKPFRFQDIKIILERIQKLHLLMEKNWLLHQELKKKKEVEELNAQLKKRIQLQSSLYNIVDSLSRISQSDDLYLYLVKKCIESCNAKKACFMIYDQLDSNLLVLAQHGLNGMNSGVTVPFTGNKKGEIKIDDHFFEAHFNMHNEKWMQTDKPIRNNGFLSIPFNIRNEPFGILLVGEKAENGSFDEEDEFLVKFLAEKAALNIENIALYDNLKQSLIASLMSLVSAIEAKDPYTQQHSSRVTEYSIKIAQKMECSYEDIQMLESSGPLHDIGKIGISDNILNKTGGLSENEVDHIKTHPLIGVNIVSPLGLDSEELAIIKHHHERWDGKGYPQGLKGEDIPRLSRILAVADSFDAMSSDRPYRKGMDQEKAFEIMEEVRGSQLCPDCLDLFFQWISEAD